ncbi:MAG: aminopeptidase, partial [Polyangiaceae bacterium]
MRISLGTKSRFRDFALRSICAAVLLFQASCSSLTYITQAAVGQNDLNVRAREIDDLLSEKRVDGRMRHLLSQVTTMKRFGEKHGLKATTNYTKYVRVDRPAVVWVVSASKQLEFKSRRWTFPFVGSFTYLGWFKLDQARAFAAELRGEGWDVDVRGAGAYSTAGFFEDSVLSTMMHDGKEGLGELANTILHESAHATFFVHHQSTLNESVANFVGDTLAASYLDETQGPDSDETKAYLANEQKSDRKGRRMRETYQSLKALYASSKSDEQKMREKQAALASLRAELGFKRPIGNATLLQYNTYNSGQAELHQLLDKCGGDWPKFIRTLKTLESQSFESSEDQEVDIANIIKPLLTKGC